MEFHILLAGGVFPLPSVAAALAYDMFLFMAGAFLLVSVLIFLFLMILYE
jgi:hypothetical protein